jgi:probable O-glycosylation ligase (exosortase A-associated)
MICILMRMRQRLLVVPILVLAGLFAVFVTPERWQQRMDFRREGALIDNSALSRVNAWTYCWRLAQEYPLAGAGFEAFTPPLFAKYAPNPQDVHGPHSIYFGVLAEHGFIGLALYLTVMASTLLSLHRVVKDARYVEDEVLENYAKMLQISVVGFLVSGAFLGRAYFDYYFTIVACTVILRRVAVLRQHEDDERTTDPEEQWQTA